ncbi:MAG: Glu-tRNA(Gln) amidotransferase subunit GatE [archaeon]|nr:Glu-tRNA(Gln) amidotransferase subunit GatE [archaeon]
MTDKFICGIEVHQQLDTEKLFCSCKSCLSDEGYGSIYRELRPTTSETGEIDRAALVQFQKNYGYRYQSVPKSSCLVELDEEPPHEVNTKAMKIALMFSEMVKARVVDEVHFMRKIVVDGSNTSGFQRTALVATNGEVIVNEKKIPIISICLEEDACRKIKATDEEITYRLDRLGIPLIEVATGPNIETPEECMEVALKIGTYLRATRNVKRGIGTIREDLNISIPGGARVEIKGIQELKLLPLYVQNEVNRQKMLLDIKNILVERKVKKVPFKTIDVTDIFKNCKSKIIKGIISDGGKVLAACLPGFAGVMNGGNGTLRLGSEMAQRAKTKGVNGILHSDELPNYGIDKECVSKINESLGITEKFDSFVICASKEEKAKDALRVVIERANIALSEIPEETRDPLPDGTSRYSRPLPGSSRMYPETDVPPIEITRKLMNEIRNKLPELPDETERRLVLRYGLNTQQAKQIIHQGNADLFEKVVKKYRMIPIAVTMFLNVYGELEHEGINVSFSDDLVMNIFEMLKKNCFAKEAIPSLLREVAAGTNLEIAVNKCGLLTIDSNDAIQIISQVVKEREKFIREKGGIAAIKPIMGLVMKKLRGKIDGKKVNEILVSEIKKLMG